MPKISDKEKLEALYNWIHQELKEKREEKICEIIHTATSNDSSPGKPLLAALLESFYKEGHGDL